MKVLLVSVPFYRLMGSHYNGINLGLGYLSAGLEKAGIECKIYNADFQPTENYGNQLQLLKYYDDYKRAMRDSCHPVWRECVDCILKYDPQWIGFSMFTANFPAVDILSRLIKKKAPDIKIVAGGPHVSLAKGIVLEKAACLDFAIYGEAEKSLLELIQGRLPGEIKGLIYRDQKRVVVNAEAPLVNDLDELSFPSRNNFYPGENQLESHYLITSRGCPNNCAFCASPVIWKRKTRFRSVDNIIAELNEMKEAGYSYIQFQDDTFTYCKERLLCLLKRMRKEKMDFQWTCDTRLSTLDEEILHAMKEANCVRIKVGVESGNEKILQAINKGITPDLALEKTRLIKQMGISLTVYLMMGFPGETDTEALDTIELARKIDADYYSLSVVAPYYGTKLYSDFLNRNGNRYKEIEDNWEYFFHQSRDMILSSKISKEVVNEFWGLNGNEGGRRL